MIFRWWRAESGFFLGLLFFFLWLGRQQFLHDPGPFWSTVLGRQILAEGAVPHAETFSCTMRGTPWNSHQWLAQCAMALADRLGGLEGLVFGAAVLLAGIYTYVASRLLHNGWHWAIVLFVVVLALLASRYSLQARPHLFSIGLMAFVFARLSDFEEGRVSVRGLFWLPAAFVLWTNLHGGALGGLATVTLVIGGWCVSWLLGLCSPVQNWRGVREQLLVLTACWLAALVNPYGWRLPHDWVRLMGSEVVAQYMVEHLPLNPMNPAERPILMFGGVYAIVLGIATARVGIRGVRVTWLLPVIWFVLTLQRVRHCTLFAVTAALAFGDVLAHTPIAPTLAQQDWLYRPGKPRDVSWRGFAVPAVVVLACLGLLAAGAAKGWTPAESELVPLALLDEIDRHTKPGDAIFNDMAYGGFLIYYRPQLRIFMDDRCELYGDEFLRDFFETNNAYRQAAESDVPRIPRFEEWAAQYGFRTALVRKTSGFDRYLASVPERWEKFGEVEERFPAGSPHAGELLWGAVLYQRRDAAP